MVGDSITIADIYPYGYAYVADEGGFELSDFPAIQVWLEKIQNDPKYISMK